ncbi:MAG: hypothetical protein GX119_10285 [Syntrophomonadaceae bacterium]|nr:hypothetical protein [Syntrophomonadaceae bacterium]
MYVSLEVVKTTLTMIINQTREGQEVCYLLADLFPIVVHDKNINENDFCHNERARLSQKHCVAYNRPTLCLLLDILRAEGCSLALKQCVIFRYGGQTTTI